MKHSTLKSTTLITATLNYADLTNANLEDANLTDANLSEAKLDFTRLGDTSLSGADLSGADLITAIDLTPKQVKEADGDKFTRLPYSIEPPPGWIEGPESSALLRRLQRRWAWLWRRALRLLR